MPRVNIDVDLASLNKAMKNVKKYDLLTQGKLKEAVNKSALAIQRGAKKRVAVDTGRLRSSITIEPYNNGLTMDVGTKVKYAAAVEYGTGLFGPEKRAIEIRPKKKKALFWPGAKHPVKKVVIKGMRARPFLFPAFEAEKSRLVTNLKNALGK